MDKSEPVAYRHEFGFDTKWRRVRDLNCKSGIKRHKTASNALCKNAIIQAFLSLGICLDATGINFLKGKLKGQIRRKG